MSGLPNESGIAEALDLALTDRVSAAAVADRDLADLIEFARSLQEAASGVRPSDEFRARSRKRLVMHMARSARQQGSVRPSLADRARVWTARIAAALGALTLAGAAAASASASALPGDAMYPVKQLTEAATLQLAPTDAARQDVLLHQADNRLDETARLLQQGRDTDAATAAAQYEQTLAALPTGSGSQSMQPEMAMDQARLTELLQTAPGPARAGLERALSATERHTSAAAQDQAVKPATTATPASRELQGSTEAADAQPANVRPYVPADEKDRARGEAVVHRAPATSDPADLPNQAHPTPVDVASDVASTNGSDGPPPRQKEPNSASEADAKSATSTDNAAPHRNPRGATGQPSRSALEHGGSAPAGRGRP